jgi:hypothetical protein
MSQLKNSTGGTLVKGTVVKADVNNDDSIVPCALDDRDPVGIVHSDIPAGQWGHIVQAGLAEVLIDNAGGCTRESWLQTSSATVGQATAIAAPPPGPVLLHFQEIGHTVRGRGSAGLVWSMIHFL